jgi:signal transduction histidine kinase
MMETPADPAVFLRRLAASRTALVQGVLYARLAALAIVVTLPGQGGALDRHAPAVTAVWAGLAVYLGAGALGSRRIAELIQRRPMLLWVDQLVCAELVVVGAGGRLAFYYLAAAPVVVATVVASVRMALALAAAQSVIVAPVLLAGVEPGLEPAHATEWAPSLAGLFVAIVLFATVRRLFVGLEEAGVAYRDRATSAAEAARREAAAEQRMRVAVGLNARMGALLRDVSAQASRLRAERPQDPEWVVQATEVERIARDAEAELGHALVEHTPAATLGEALTVACDRLRRLGAEHVRLEMDACCELPLHPVEAAALTRFAQEALANAWKHGRPPVAVHARRDGRRITVCVADAGPGFDPSGEPRQRGMRSLLHDAEALGGRLSVTRPECGGSRVELEFEAADG